MAIRGHVAAAAAAVLLWAPVASGQTGLDPPPWKAKRPELARWRAVKSIEGHFDFTVTLGAPETKLTSGSGKVSASGTASLRREPLDPWFPARVVFTGPIRGSATFDQQVDLAGKTTKQRGGCAGKLAQDEGDSYLTVTLDLDEGTFHWDMAGVVKGCQDPQLSVAMQRVEAEADTAAFTAAAAEPSRIPASKIGLRASGPAFVTGGQMLPLTGRGNVLLTLGDAPGEEKLELSGCSDLGFGATSTVTAKGEPEGGTYRFWTEPSGKLSVQASEGEATLSCSSPGRTKLHVEYTGGGKQRASQPGSCAKVDLVNFGFPVPRIGLLDIDGKRNPKVQVKTVPVKARPEDVATLLDFDAADPGVVTAEFLGDKLHLQAVKVGKTTVRARTRCGDETGPTVQVEVVLCDDDVVAELDRKAEKAVQRVNRITQHETDILNDPEVVRAEKEFLESAGKAFWATAKVIASSATAGAKVVGKSVGTAEKLISLVDAGDKMEKAITRDEVDLAGSLLQDTLETPRLVATAAVAGAAKDFAEAAEANSKLAKDFGALKGALDRLEEAEENRKGAQAESERLVDLLTSCKQGSASAEPPAAQGGTGSGGSSGQPRSAGGRGKPAEPAGGGGASSRQGGGKRAGGGSGTGWGGGPGGGTGSGTGTGPGGGSGTGAGSGGSGSGGGPGTGPGGGSGTGSGGGGGQDRPPGSRGSGGFPWPAQGGKCSPFSSGAERTVQAGLGSLKSAGDEFGSKLAAFQQRLPGFQRTIDGIVAAAGLDYQRRQAKFRQLLPEIASFKSAAKTMGSDAEAFLSTMEGCDTAVPEAMGATRESYEALLKEQRPGLEQSPR